jgi:uncharacterized membrane protein YeaQ/YmgE (transglycosylase-associated protein family)
MGLYLWIAIGFVVGVIARLFAHGRVVAGWLEPALVGTAGGVMGGWIGARIWGDGSINAVGVASLAGAAIGGAALAAAYISSSRPRPVTVPRVTQEEERPRRAA